MLLNSVSSVLIVYWLAQVALSTSEVVLVNRDGIDSFRVGEDGCNNTKDCPTSATCQTDGLCKCNSSTPTYRTFIRDSDGLRGLVYGCVNNSLISLSSENEIGNCSFGTSNNVIPSSHNGSASAFTYNDPGVKLKTCSLVNAWSKTPNSSKGTKLKWMNESYVNLNVSNTSLYFKWKRSIKKLQGTVIYFSLNCTQALGQSRSLCLGGKVLGNWSAVPSKTRQPTPTETTHDYDLNILSKIVIGGLALSFLVIIVLAIVGCRRKKQQKHEDPYLEETEMPTIDEQREENPETKADGYAVVRRGRNNKGASIISNNERVSDVYEEMPTGTERNFNLFQAQQDNNNERLSEVYEDMIPGTANTSSFKEPLYRNNERLSDVYEEQEPGKKYTTLRRNNEEEEEEDYQSLTPVQEEKEIQV